MSAPARLVDHEGHMIAPGALCWRAEKIGPECVSSARRSAYREGRVIEHDDMALFAFGVAARVELPGGLAEPEAARTASALVSAIVDDKHTSTIGLPLAIGALDFGRERPGSLVVPRVAVVSDRRGEDHAIVVWPSGHEPPGAIAFDGDDSSASGVDEPPDDFVVASTRSEEDYLARVHKARDAVRAGDLDKVVLARELLIGANRPFRRRDIVKRLRASHPTCAVFAIDGFLGATPELLITRRGRTITSRPLAGTVPRRPDAADDAALVARLRVSTKENSEHRFVVDDVVATFTRHTEPFDVPETPELYRLANVTHLATPLRATLAEALATLAPSAFELAAELHPTSAVAGSPRDTALEYLRRNEGLDRDRYGGPVGWVDAAGDGEWWIAIRSAFVDGARARLIAGAGIVADSEPDAELEETAAKFEALLTAFTNATPP